MKGARLDEGETWGEIAGIGDIQEVIWKPRVVELLGIHEGEHSDYS